MEKREVEGKENKTDQPQPIEEKGEDSPLKKSLRKSIERDVPAGLKQVQKGLVRKIAAAIVIESPDDVPTQVKSTASVLVSGDKQDDSAD